jgi:hypothetical protein
MLIPGNCCKLLTTCCLQCLLSADNLLPAMLVVCGNLLPAMLVVCGKPALNCWQYSAVFRMALIVEEQG